MADRRGRGRHDRGATFVEMLVAIVLLGTAVVGTLTALRTTLIGTRIDRNHSSAYSWLQSASDSLAVTPYRSCVSSTNAQIVTAYEAAANAAVRPVGWESTTGATVDVTAVRYLSRAGTTESWGTTCAAGDPDSPVYAQLVTVEVVSPDGSFSARLDVIKGA